MTTLDHAVDSLRFIANGPKGDREDYVGTISGADATALLRFIDTIKPLYDTHAITADELRFLRIIRGLPPAAMEELVKFEAYLAAASTPFSSSLDRETRGGGR